MEVTLSQTQAAQIVQTFGWSGPVAVEQVHVYNHVYRLSNGDRACFLKTYTKDWYGDDALATAGCVEHEASAWRMLANHNLAVPHVLVTAYDGANPLGRPFIVTSELAGLSLTDAVLTDKRDAVLYALGVYLHDMHAITFDQPGYIMAEGSKSWPESGWQHPIWSFAAWQASVLAGLEREASALPTATYQQLLVEFNGAEPILGPAFVPPRFTHGDCWASQFFVVAAGGAWQTSGVVDLEVASAGDAESDFVHLLMELASVLGPETRWWKDLFAGYGREPDRAAFRLRLLGTSEAEFAAVGWPGLRSDRCARLLAADDWNTLLRAT